MKLFLIHAVYNLSEICYRDLINKVKIELLREKLLNTPTPPPPPPNAEKSICFNNEAASTSLKQQVARSTRRRVAPGAHISYIIQRKQFNSSNWIILYGCFNSLNFKRLFESFLLRQWRLNLPAVNAIQWRHYFFALIYAKSKTRFSTGKQRNIVWKCLHDTELLYSFYP